MNVPLVAVLLVIGALLCNVVGGLSKEVMVRVEWPAERGAKWLALRRR